MPAQCRQVFAGDAPVQGGMARRLEGVATVHSWAVPIGRLGPHPAGTTRGSGGYVPQNCPTRRRSYGKHPKVPDPRGWRWLPEASDLSAPRPHHPHSVCPPSPTAEHLLSEHLQLEQGRPAGAQGGSPAFSGLGGGPPPECLLCALGRPWTRHR